MIRFNKKEMDRKLKMTMEVVRSIEESKRIEHEETQKGKNNS